MINNVWRVVRNSASKALRLAMLPFTLLFGAIVVLALNFILPEDEQVDPKYPHSYY